MGRSYTLYTMKKIQFDGAAIPTPGKMGIGVVLIENSYTNEEENSSEKIVLIIEPY